MTIKPLVFATLISLMPLGAQTSVPAPTSHSAYRVELTLQQTQTGQAPVSHTYVLVLQTDGQGASMNMGSHVPIRGGPEKIDYQSVGLSLSCRFSHTAHPLPEDQLGLLVDVSISRIANESGPPAPTIRSTDARIDTVVPLGRRISISRFQDPDSNSSYELEILATPVPSAADAAPVSGN